MKILITRPKEQAEKLAKFFFKNNIDYIIEPMQLLEESSSSLDKGYLAKANLILFTSQNSIKFFTSKSNIRDIKTCVLGEESYHTALELGFKNPIVAANNAENLVNYIEQNYDKSSTIIYHPTQNNQSIDIEHILTKKLYKIKSEIIYKTINTTEFSPKLQNEIQNEKISHALFYSKLNAQIFVTLVKKYHFEEYMRHIKAYCLSERIKNELLALNFSKIFVASRSGELLNEVLDEL